MKLENIFIWGISTIILFLIGIIMYGFFNETLEKISRETIILGITNLTTLIMFTLSVNKRKKTNVDGIFVITSLVLGIAFSINLFFKPINLVFLSFGIIMIIMISKTKKNSNLIK